MDRREFVMRSLLGATLVGSAGCDASRSDPVSEAPPLTSANATAPAPFLSWDGGSGPNRAFWSQKLQLPWAHPGVGDWLDARQQSQGVLPWATAQVAQGRVELDASALLEHCLRSGVNRGFYLRSTEAWPFVFAGRRYAQASERPDLRVETESGILHLTCSCNASWTPSSFSGKDSREQFEVAAGNQFVALQFDLAPLSQTGVARLRRATLRLSCLSLRRPGRLELFELDPPQFRIGKGNLDSVPGIAQNYVYDKGLAGHPGVLFVADFADLSKARWQTGGVAPGSSRARDPRSGSTQLLGQIPAGQLQGCDLEHSLVRGTAGGVPDSVETDLYARYYMLLEDDWGSEVDANKMPGWDARLGWWDPAGYWQSTTGNGGRRASGMKLRNEQQQRWEYEGASMRGHGGGKANDGNPYDGLFWLGNYMYHLDQQSEYGDPLCWTGVVTDKGHWHCIEQHIRMNSITGPFDAAGNGVAVNDGVYRVWMDGVPAFARSNLRWRKHPEMGIQGFWLNWFHGGSAPAPRTMHFRMDGVVIARSYIGPRKEG